MVTNEFLRECYDMGYDSAKKGANTINAHFKYFSSKETLDQWNEGRKDALNSKEPKAISEANVSKEWKEGLKAGLELAKEIAKKQGYKLKFPESEEIFKMNNI